MTPIDDEPVSLHDSLGEVASELRIAGPDAARVLESEVATVLGAELSGHVRVGSVRDRILVLQVDDPAFATPLRYLETRLVEALTQRLGAGVVQGVRTVVRRPRERP